MKFLKETYPVLIGALILSLIAFYNGYALVYPDTGSYIASGFGMFVPNDRPITYGLFVRLFGPTSLWTVIIFQNIITSYILYQVFGIFFISDKRKPFYFYLSITFLTFFTAIAWYSNQIMPDLFTPLLLICLFLLFYQKKIHPAKFIFLSGMLIFTVVTHFSHLLIVSFTTFFILLVNFGIFRKWLTKHSLKVQPKRALLVTIIGLSGWIVLPSLNAVITGNFFTNRSSHIFFMASMAEKGILESFLKEKCDEAEFSDCKLCLYKNEIPKEVGVFIWSGDSSVFQKTGGWQNSKAEYDKIIRATLVSPKYLSMHIFKSFAFGMTQLLENKIGSGLGGFREGTSPYAAVNEKYHGELNMYLNSRQNKFPQSGIQQSLIILNHLNTVLLILSVLFLVCIYFAPFRTKLDAMTVLFLTIMLIGIIVNSFVTAGLSAPYARYEAKVVWLMELALIILMVKNWSVLKESVYTIFKRSG